MKPQDQKQLGEEKVYFAYTFISWSITEGNQDRSSNRCSNLEVGADAEANEEGYLLLLACSSWLAQSVFYKTQDHQSKHGTTHNGMLPDPINQ